MAGKDITEKIPVNIGNPGTTGFWVNNAEEYDVAIGGYPFLLVPTDLTPYQRETAPYRKDQFDNGREPGEQSLTGWWLRSQSSFHNGAGIKFYDSSAGESIPYRFTDSQGVDVWTKGEVSLLHSTVQGHVTTGRIRTNGRPYQFMQSIQWGTTNGVLLHDEEDIDKIDSAGNLTHFVNAITGTSEPIYAVCNDGTHAYFIGNVSSGGVNQLHFFKKPLTGDETTGSASATPTGDVVKMFNANGIVVTNATMRFVKDRIIACINNAVYEIAPNATSLPTPVYTNTNTNYIYTSISASGSAIYTSGYSGIYSTIHKYELNTSTGAMPVLAQPVVAAEFPAGERVLKLFYYLGKLMIGTNKGIRVAAVDDSAYNAGSITYGPLVVETTQDVYDFAARDRFVWALSLIHI